MTDPDPPDIQPNDAPGVAGLATPPVAQGLLPGLIGYNLRRAQLAVFQDFGRAVAGLELSPAQFTVMHLLRHNPPLRSAQLAAALGIKRANFVVLLERLERGGLVERRRDARDGRAATLHLLPEGEELVREAERRVRAHERRIARRLEPGGGATLLRLLAQLSDGG